MDDYKFWIPVVLVLVLGLIVIYSVLHKKPKQKKCEVCEDSITLQFTKDHQDFITINPEKYLKIFQTAIQNLGITIAESTSDFSIRYENDDSHATDIIIKLIFRLKLDNHPELMELQVSCHYLNRIEALYFPNSAVVQSFSDQDIKNSLYLLGVINDEN